jgi:hypothetical protein
MLQHNVFLNIHRDSWDGPSSCTSLVAPCRDKSLYFVGFVSIVVWFCLMNPLLACRKLFIMSQRSRSKSDSTPIFQFLSQSDLIAYDKECMTAEQHQFGRCLIAV